MDRTQALTLLKRGHTIIANGVCVRDEKDLPDDLMPQAVQELMVQQVEDTFLEKDLAPQPAPKAAAPAPKSEPVVKAASPVTPSAPAAPPAPVVSPAPPAPPAPPTPGTQGTS